MRSGYGHKIRLEISPPKAGKQMEAWILVNKALIDNETFVLHDDQSVALFDPATLIMVQGKSSIKYTDPEDFLDAIKLAIIFMHNVIFPYRKQITNIKTIAQ